MLTFAKIILALLLCTPTVQLKIQWHRGGRLKHDDPRFPNIPTLEAKDFSGGSPLGAGKKGTVITANYQGRTVAVKSAIPDHEYQLTGGKDPAGTKWVGDIEVFEKLSSRYSRSNTWPPGVVACVGLLLGDGCPSVVMEFVVGHPLDAGHLANAIEKAVRSSGWSPEAVVDYLHDKAKATAKSLEEAEVTIHDVNPNNFIIPSNVQELMTRGIVWIDVGGYKHVSDRKSSGTDYGSLEWNVRKIYLCLQDALRATRMKPDKKTSLLATKDGIGHALAAGKAQ